MHRSAPNELEQLRSDARGAGGTTSTIAGGHLPDEPHPAALAATAADERVRGRYERHVKPVIDRLGGVTLFLLALPVMVLTAVAVRIKLGKGVIYRQERVGWKGETFTVYKFRTMLPDRRRSRRRPFAGTDRRKRHKTPADPRHTSFGRFLRDFSLDELPQLWNVVRGDLSLVGPRPELVDVVERYEGWQHRRHAVKPGLTGLWQVTERDERGEMHLHVETDLRYIRTLSWINDLKILTVTPLAILGFAIENSFGLRDLGDLGRRPPVTAVPDAEHQVA